MHFKKNFLAACNAALIFLFFFVLPVCAETVEDSGSVSVSAYVGNVNSVIFSGKACPLCQTTLLLSGVIENQDTCKVNSSFQLASTNIPAGSYIFGIYSTDAQNSQSGTSSFNADVTQGTLLYFSDILISPTLTAESEVEQGDDLVISGYTVADADVTIILDSGEELAIATKADGDGFFSHTLTTDSLTIGTYSIKAKAVSGSDISPYGRIIEFEVKAKTESSDEEEEEADTEEDVCEKVDYNNDDKINVVDFSILLHWYGKNNTPESIDLNDDSRVNLTDFSMLIYCWSG